jgi:hypothetical protein
MLQTLLPVVDPGNKARIIEWATDVVGENKNLFPQPLILDYDSLSDYQEQQTEQQQIMNEQKAEEKHAKAEHWLKDEG